MLVIKGDERHAVSHTDRFVDLLRRRDVLLSKDNFDGDAVGLSFLHGLVDLFLSRRALIY